jgi:hypothetical protein
MPSSRLRKNDDHEGRHSTNPQPGQLLLEEVQQQSGIATSFFPVGRVMPVVRSEGTHSGTEGCEDAEQLHPAPDEHVGFLRTEQVGH